MQIQQLKSYTSINIGSLQIYYIKSTETFSQRYQRDIIKGIYEGGFKLWQCTIDMLHFLDQYDFRGKKVLQIGCGHGLIGILAILKGASLVVFQDYNKEVLTNLTEKNIQLNIAEFANKRFYYGDWGNMRNLNETQICQTERFDVILGSELIYDEANYKKISDLIKMYLEDTGQSILGNKHYYFGVGGNMPDFKEHLDSVDGLTYESLKKIVPKSGNKKQIVRIIKKLKI